MQERGIGWVRRQVGIPGGPEAPASHPAPQERLRTFVHEGAEFEGTLRLRESFRIDGEFRGEIVSEGTVVIGPAAGIVANVRAREVVVAGAVKGDLVATRQLVLRSGARVHGDVETPCLEVEKGASLNGRTTMVRPQDAALARAKAPPADALP